MPYDKKGIKAHWRNLIDQSRYKNNIEGLSMDIGKSSSYLRAVLRNNSMPAIDACMALCEALGCTLDELMNISPVPPLSPKEIGDAISNQVSQIMSDRIRHNFGQPTGEDVMEWWLANNGRLENYDRIRDRFDLFEVPDGTHRRLMPYELGKRSLASISLGTTSHDVYHRTVGPLCERYRDLILIAQRSSLDTGPVTTIETLDAIHPDSREEIKIEYARTFAPVTLPDGKQLVLNYSKLLRETGEIPGSVGQVDAARDNAHL